MLVVERFTCGGGLFMGPFAFSVSAGRVYRLILQVNPANSTRANERPG